jgi:rfaE bifunctional protein nucleotidyltransferase chain/domain
MEGTGRRDGAELSAGILNLHQAILQFGPGKRNGRRVVFTNGCFDLLHPGHIELLEKARALGDALIVGVNCDQVVTQLKGRDRPIWTAKERAEVLAAFGSVDAVVIFDEPTPREIISALLPDVLVKGGDWPIDKIVGREEVEAAGGKVVSIPILSGHSTTAIIAKIRAMEEPGGTDRK